MSKRLLIVADDFGYGCQRNNGILQCFKSKAISGVSLLANCKHSNAAVQLAKLYNVPVGLHFNITEGLPLSDPRTVASLLGPDGKFIQKHKFWHDADILPKHVATELEAQISWFYSHFGQVPHRIDGHQHVHVHPNVAHVFASLLKLHKVQSTRVPIEYHCSEHNTDLPIHRKAFHMMVEDASRNAEHLFRKFNINFPEAFVGLNFVGSSIKVELLKKMLKSVFDSGVEQCELMVHPGYRCNIESDGFLGDQTADTFSCSVERENELAVLTSDEMKQFYDEETIVIDAVF